MVIQKLKYEKWMSDDLCKLSKQYNDIIWIDNLYLNDNIIDIPANIIFLIRPNIPLLSIIKDHKHVSTYSLSSNPKVIETYFKSKKYNLDSYEHSQITKFIKLFYPIIITYIDGKINEDELEIEIQKINRSKNDERI